MDALFYVAFRDRIVEGKPLLGVNLLGQPDFDERLIWNVPLVGRDLDPLQQIDG